MSDTTSTDDLTPLYRQLLQQTLQPQPVPLPQGPQPSSREGRGWVSLLGEALGGGAQYGTPDEREQAGIAALTGFGARMLQASDYSYQPHTFGSIFAQGLGGAQEALQSRERVSAATAAAQQEWQQKQQEMQLGRIKEAIPILTALQTLQQQRRIAGMPSSLGGTPGTTPGTSLALTGDLEKDRAIIAQRESGGDPTALNYVARADPTAYDRGATASGKYQFVNSTWQEGLKLAGLDGSKYPTARDAPESVQDKVFTAVYQKHGTAPWDPSSWKSNWVQDPATGKYNLVQGAPYQPPPGKGTTTTASAATATAAPTIIQGKPGEAPPPPPSLPPGPATTYAGGGIGTALAPKLPEPPIPPPGGVPVPGGGGLVLNPDTGRIGTPGGGFKAADIIEHGMQLARASRAAGDGSVLAAGPAAPTAVATAPSTGFVGGATSYGGGPATAAPPAVPAPQPASQAPPTPATPITTPPDQAPATPGTSPPTFSYVRHDPPPGMLLGSKLTPEEQSVVTDARNAYQNAIRVAITPEQRQQAEATLQATLDKELTARAGRTDTAAKQMADWYANDFKQQQEQHKLAVDNYYKNQNQQQELANQLKIKQQEMENTLRVNKEAVFNQANQKGLETAQTEQANARDIVTQAEGFRVLSDNVGQPGWLQTTKFPGTDQTIAEKLQQAGWKLDDTSGVQMLRGGINNLIKTLRQGMPMGSLSDRDLSFIERMGPTEWMDQDTRTAAVSYIVQAYRAKMNFARDVQKEMSRGLNYGDAIDAADQKQKPFVPTVPRDLTLSWDSKDPAAAHARAQWAQENDVGPGTLFHLSDGRIMVMRDPNRVPRPGQR